VRTRTRLSVPPANVREIDDDDRSTIAPTTHCTLSLSLSFPSLFLSCPLFLRVSRRYGWTRKKVKRTAARLTKAHGCGLPSGCSGNPVGRARPHSATRSSGCSGIPKRLTVNGPPSLRVETRTSNNPASLRDLRERDGRRRRINDDVKQRRLERRSSSRCVCTERFATRGAVRHKSSWHGTQRWDLPPGRRGGR